MLNNGEDGVADCDACGGCAVSDRRAFLKQAMVAVAGVAASLGLARGAEALPLSAVRALGRRGNSHAYAIPAGDGVAIDHENDVILTRWQGNVYAFALSCPHQNTALRWDDADHRFQCPKHHSKYQPSGEFIEGRATRGMDRFALRRDGGNVVVDLDTLYREDENAAAWKAAFVPAA